MLWFLPVNAPRAFGGRAPSGPAGRAYIAPPDPLAAFKGSSKDKGMGKEEGWGQEREEAGYEGRYTKGRREGRERGT